MDQTVWHSIECSNTIVLTIFTEINIIICKVRLKYREMSHKPYKKPSSADNLNAAPSSSSQYSRYRLPEVEIECFELEMTAPNSRLHHYPLESYKWDFPVQWKCKILFILDIDVSLNPQIHQSSAKKWVTVNVNVTKLHSFTSSILK